MMRNFFKGIGILVGLAVLAGVVLMPWMDRWGATEKEIAASYPGDELVPSPRITYTRAISIDAAPEEIYPWIVQLGADKGGMYSYTWFESSVLQCPQVNADRIHEEWQDLEEGDKVLLCPDENAPPAYTVAKIVPDQAIVLGHQENGQWIEVWQFILLPQDDGTTRLVVRSRSMAEGWLWDVIRPGEFIMMRGMLLGIQERAEGLAHGG
ncbi:MAG TPA: hypothetical protein VFY26_03520 [Anaerolineales bacterium]|nr:hypothetical protein [Anaerolineales bacterium]